MNYNHSLVYARVHGTNSLTISILLVSLQAFAIGDEATNPHGYCESASTEPEPRPQGRQVMGFSNRMLSEGGPRLEVQTVHDQFKIGTWLVMSLASSAERRPSNASTRKPENPFME